MKGSVYSILVELLIFTACGIFLSRKSIISSDASKVLSDFLLKLVLPFSLIASSQQRFKGSALYASLVSLLLGFIYYLLSFLLCFLILPLFIKDRESLPISFDLVLFANVGFLGFSVIPLLFGNTATLYTIFHNFVFQLFFFTIGMEKAEGSEKSVREILSPQKLLTNKIIMISAASMILYCLPFRFPAMITDSISAIGSMMTPLSLIIVGLQIGSMDPYSLIKEKRVIPLTLIRMLLLPALFFIVLILLPFDVAVKRVAFILYCMPSASLSAVIAEKYNRRPALACSVVALSTLIFFALLPLDLVACDRFFS